MAPALSLQGSAGVETQRGSPHYPPRGKLIGRGWRGSLGRHWPRLRLHSETGSHGRVQGFKGRWRDQKFGHSGRGCQAGPHCDECLSLEESGGERGQGLGCPSGPGPAPRWESEQERTPGAPLHCPFSLICVLTAQGPLDQEAVTTQAGPAEAGTRGRCLCLGAGVVSGPPADPTVSLCCSVQALLPSPPQPPIPIPDPSQAAPCGTSQGSISQEPELCPPKPCPLPSQREMSENPRSSLAPQGLSCPSRQSQFWLIPN